MQKQRIVWGPGIRVFYVGVVFFFKTDRRGAPPPTHGQTARGFVVPVSWYTERDRGVLEAAVRETLR